jgi:hypothetical protein
LPFQLDQKTNTIFRAVVGDADREAAARRDIRSRRQERTTHNLNTSQSLRELEDLNSAMVRLCRDERKTDSMLRYESRMYLEDLRMQVKQPLGRMSKRPNTEMGHRMWGGSFNAIIGDS